MNVLLSGRFDAAERQAWWNALSAAAPQCQWHRDDAPFDRTLIDAAVVGSAPGSVWVRLRPLPAAHDAENGVVVAADEAPVFVTVLHAHPAQGTRGCRKLRR